MELVSAAQSTEGREAFGVEANNAVGFWVGFYDRFDCGGWPDLLFRGRGRLWGWKLFFFYWHCAEGTTPGLLGLFWDMIDFRFL